ncbi:MAG: S-methyl-5-thioribose kinase [Acidimicrobiales bacterium]
MDSDYLILTEATVPDYIRQRPELMARIDPGSVSVREVGDGNLNLVFVCRDDAGSAIVLKQSLPYVRVVGPSWPLTADRSHAEAKGLTEAFHASPATAPRLHSYDAFNHVLAMEDLSCLTVWRTALNYGHIAPNAAAECGRHVARLLVATGYFGLDGEAFRSNVHANRNRAMCRITEDLVFTQPFVEHPNNRFDNCLQARVDLIRSDKDLLDQVARLKADFMTREDALIHGDLHTGSVMVGTSDAPATKIIDPEFCFYGPIAFDLGVLLANLLFAALRADCLARDHQSQWLTELPVEMWNAFEEEFWTLWPQRVDESMSTDHASDWLQRVARDAIGFAGCEAVRRVVGFAKVSDIEDLPPELRVVGAAAALDTARNWLTESDAEWCSDLLTRPTVGRGR